MSVRDTKALASLVKLLGEETLAAGQVFDTTEKLFAGISKELIQGKITGLAKGVVGVRYTYMGVEIHSVDYANTKPRKNA